jgi:hypothetical protein
LDADGTAVDTYRGQGAPANSLVTVATTLGTIMSADQNGTYQGVQVQADGAGVFTFQVKRPSGTGGTGNAAATITAQEVLGRNLGSLTQEYQPPQSPETVLRFDFNASATYTQAGFTGVGPRDLYSGTRGYGWSTRVAAADRNPGSGWSNLNRDLHTGSKATFRVQVGAGTYNVRLYLPNPLGNGTYAYTYDNFDVIVEGSSKTATVATLTPGAIRIEDFTGPEAGRDVNGDGILDIQFIDRGGQNFNWVVSGLEISTGSLGTAVNYLTAGEAPSAASAGGATIRDAALAPLVAEAAARWSAAGLTPAQAAVLTDLHVGVADLGGSKLGLAYPTTHEIRIDDDAAGWGWNVERPVISDQWRDGGQIFLNPEPRTPKPGVGTLNPAGVDLLTAVMHEMGHLLGYGHAVDGLMSPVLAAGRSRAGSRAKAVEPLGQAEWRIRPSSFAFRSSSAPDGVFADMVLDSDEETPLDCVPRRSRMQRYERDLDAWFAELAAAEQSEPSSVIGSQYSAWPPA